MIGASKILTVSYGTFSCTLEGFDDSFSTMKAIAEYFRDLAADDRYFGAEPPTPDAEMLAKIAGREINRQVEAKIEDTGVTLRPAGHAIEIAEPAEQSVEESPQISAEAPEPVAAPEVEDVHIQQVAPTAEYDDIQDDAPFEFAADENDQAGDTESVAAKLRRIRAVVNKTPTVAATTSIFPEDQDSEVYIPDAILKDEPADDQADQSTVLSAFTPEALEEDEPADVEVEVEVEAEAEEEVEATAEVEAEAEDEATVEAEADVEDEVEAEADDEVEAAADMDAEEDDEIEVEAEAEMEVDDTTDDDNSDNNNSVVNILDAVTEEDTIQDADNEEDESEEGESSDLTLASDDSDDDVGESDETDDEEITPDPVVPVRPVSARIIKMKRAESAQTDADTDVVLLDTADIAVDESADTDVQDDDQEVSKETDLTAADEADLISELAEIENGDNPVLDHGIDTMLRTDRANRALHDEGGAKDEAAVSRLMDETNAKLDTSENTRKRSAISHLRAAVAATVADRVFNPNRGKKATEETELYRNDLADVVQPKANDDEQDEQTDSQPAPLVLISEQRIDDEEHSEPKPLPVTIRPRRVVKDTDLHEVSGNLTDLISSETDSGDDDGSNIFANSTSFADFAKKMGANDLPDLLEAAAAYTAYVEGRPHFARPQIMRQVESFAGKEEFNREEGLRSFGQLLRQGKIKKIKRGQFEIADSTRFKPEARIAGE